VFGDWGTGPEGAPTLDLLTKTAELHNFDAVLHIGDIAYDLQDYSGRTGDLFGRNIEPIAGNFPYMTIPGNHEDFKNATHYQARYNMPVNDANQGTDTFYSFNLGAAHYIMFDTERYLNFDDVGAM
jgi:hypothetical protein